MYPDVVNTKVLDYLNAWCALGVLDDFFSLNIKLLDFYGSLKTIQLIA